MAKCVMFMHVIDSYGNIMNCLTTTVNKESITLNKDNPLYKKGHSVPTVNIFIFSEARNAYMIKKAKMLNVMDAYLFSPEIRSCSIMMLLLATICWQFFVKSAALEIFVALYARAVLKRY